MNLTEEYPIMRKYTSFLENLLADQSASAHWANRGSLPCGLHTLALTKYAGPKRAVNQPILA